MTNTTQLVPQPLACSRPPAIACHRPDQPALPPPPPPLPPSSSLPQRDSLRRNLGVVEQTAANIKEEMERQAKVARSALHGVVAW